MKNIKSFLLYNLSIILLEITFYFFTKEYYDIKSIINIILYSLIIGNVLNIITSLFNNKIKYIFNIINFIFLGFYFSLQYVYFQTLKIYFCISSLQLSDQISGFMSTLFSLILKSIPIILIFFSPLILLIIFRKKINIVKNKINMIVSIITLVLCLGLYIGNMYINKNDDNSLYELYFKTVDNDLNVEKTGVLSALNLDIYRTLFDIELIDDSVYSDSVYHTDNVLTDSVYTETVYEKNIKNLNFDKKTSNSTIKSINTYMKNDKGTSKNIKTGIYNGYNVVYLTAESFYEIGVIEELTPTLYKLVNEGFKFNNFYTTTNLSTIGGEFQSLTGLFADTSILSKFRKGNNYFPQGLGKMFKNNGYKTYAYHDHYYTFQDRNKYLKSQGFTNYKACYNGLESKINCNQWPESDLAMMKVTYKDYIDSSKPFLAYYMTVSGHYRYNWGGNSIAAKNKKYVKNLKYNDEIKAYIATQIELDKALEYLINKLDKAGKLDNTLFVLTADHYPYGLKTKSINTISEFKRDNTFLVNHNALIIWNSKQEHEEINKTCMTLDVVPTLYNLMGFEYDSRLFMGKDIFSDSEGIAMFSKGNWMTDKGKYNSSKSKFTPNEGIEVDDSYVKRINSIVKKRINMSKNIINTNYYNYLYK